MAADRWTTTPGNSTEHSAIAWRFSICTNPLSLKYTDLYNVGLQWAKRLMLTGDTINGPETQQIGLVLKSVPMENLEQEVEQLADRLEMIDPDLLSANKRIINMALELMGRERCSEWRLKTTFVVTTRKVRRVT